MTSWYRTGKVVSSGEATIQEALALQRTLILWTAVHMRPQLAAKGNEGARQLEVGFHWPTLTMAEPTDAAIDEEETEEIIVPEQSPVRGVSIKNIGFRPDFNPPGILYKRRERAAKKKKKSALEEIVAASFFVAEATLVSLPRRLQHDRARALIASPHWHRHQAPESRHVPNPE